MVTTLQACTLAIALTAAGQVPAGGETAVFDFTADWCGPCKSMRALVARLAAVGWPIREVDVDREPGLAARFRVTSIPCFVLVVDGKELDRAVGVVDFGRLAQMAQRAQHGRNAAAWPAREATAPLGTVLPVSLPGTDQGARGYTTVPSQASPSAGAGGDPAILQETVRIRVDDRTGRSYGTGTIIDARDGQAVVLTCGHLFREAHDSGQILVDLFQPTGAKTVPAALISYDLNRDLGLLAIRPDGPVAVAPVAPKGLPISHGDRVASAGCNHGREPTVRQTHVTAVDRYEGPSNIEAAGSPVEGRSGGGLFDQHGRLIGVCFAADAVDNEGLYAGLDSIHAELERLGLGHCAAVQPAAGGGAPALLAQSLPPPVPRQMPTPTAMTPVAADPGQAGPATATAAAGTAQPIAAPVPLSASEQTALAEIRRRAQGSELICIVRPADPSQKSEIFVLENVSAQLIEQLTQSQRQRSAPQLTSMAIPKPAAARGHSGSHQELDDANGWQATPPR
ncbi:MAG: hypothetical protein A2W31_07150 [Planctomycetes bacterium RBG_16_64_10]|nr:MAG: hypothetical protein A2W31_07150 [Planctomycetes bacterium RBG_16_64_10]